MAEKVLQTRIQLKYDTYANWQASTVVLKAGEIAIATIPTGATGSGSSHLPAVMAKVGDGTHKFSELNWIQSVAADVHDWAKAANKPSYGSNEITVATGNGVSATNVQAAIKELADSIGALTGSSSGSIADLISAEINKLNLGTASTATIETTGVSSNSTTIPTTAQVKSYVDGAVGAVKNFEYEVVPSLPTAAAGTMNKIYLVADTHSDSNDSYDEFITLKNGSSYSWEKIGNTDVNLSDYYTKTEANNLLNNKIGDLIANNHNIAGQAGDVIFISSDLKTSKDSGVVKLGTTYNDSNGKITFNGIAATGNAKYLTQTTGDVLVFNCGSSTSNI